MKNHQVHSSGRRGGARPGTGGYRPGAGRKPGIPMRLAAAGAMQARLEEVERREAALVGRSDALDKREADIAADAARRSAELYDQQKKLDARDAELKARLPACRQR